MADVGDAHPGVTDAVQFFAMLLGVGSPQACTLVSADLQASFAAAAPTCAAVVERLARSGLDLRLPEITAAAPGAVEIAGDRASLVVGTPDAGAGGEPQTWSLRRAGGGTWLLEHVPFAVLAPVADCPIVSRCAAASSSSAPAPCSWPRRRPPSPRPPRRPGPPSRS